MGSDSEKQRKRMVEHDLAARDIGNERVLGAFLKVPREEFVPEDRRYEAYEDHPVRIARGQTISQPYMVAFMTQALELQGNERALEIGTGSGYQAAILAELAREVYTVERIAELSESAREVLKGHGYRNIRFRVGDGTLGWPEEAPFDRIVVTAAAKDVPGALLRQLADGGILLMPAGPESGQVLLIVRRKGEVLRTATTCHCIFVKLI